MICSKGPALLDCDTLPDSLSRDLCNVRREWLALVDLMRCETGMDRVLRWLESGLRRLS